MGVDRYRKAASVRRGPPLDGCFFDNFFTTQSWLKADIYAATPSTSTPPRTAWKTIRRGSMPRGTTASIAN
ncbi:MAG: hypothetical protein NTW28_15240 [Candidatus Solibacter sp.]|nr:hypothetical protein [Candidatus Solibacter sp.]